jgi:hypothetical protein
LPTPFGPTNRTLAASLRKSSVISASAAARSQCLGQFQSEVAERLEAADMRGAERTFQAAQCD